MSMFVNSNLALLFCTLENQQSGMKSSFEKKISNSSGPGQKIGGGLPKIPGTRPSVHNYQLLVGSGIPALDQVVFRQVN